MFGYVKIYTAVFSDTITYLLKVKTGCRMKYISCTVYEILIILCKVVWHWIVLILRKIDVYRLEFINITCFYYVNTLSTLL